MSQAAVAIPIPAERQGWSRFTGFVADSVAMLTRNIITLRRVPQLLVFSTIQPVIFVLLFVYVFGGAVGNATGLPYIDFLVPGIFVQMSVFGAMGTAIGLASDVKSGLLERFHALPMARSAVLAGRTSADVVRNVFVILLVSGVALLIGFRVHTNVFGYVGGSRWCSCSDTRSRGCSPAWGSPSRIPRRHRRPRSRSWRRSCSPRRCSCRRT